MNLFLCSFLSAKGVDRAQPPRKVESCNIRVYYLHFSDQMNHPANQNREAVTQNSCTAHVVEGLVVSIGLFLTLPGGYSGY